MKHSPVLAAASRTERRLVLRREEQARRSGDWGLWEKLDMPAGVPGAGWCSEVRTAWRNVAFCVLERHVPMAVRHLAVSSLSGTRPTWWEMQRIKDELAGIDATAVEIYPPHAEIVDGADMFHIWVLPAALPFSLRDGL